MTNSNTSIQIKKPQTMTGIVVSAKMQETASVAVTRFIPHPKYKKYYKIVKKFLAHNPKNTAKEGDKVVIKSIRPMSKRKSFAIISNSGSSTKMDDEKTDNK